MRDDDAGAPALGGCREAAFGTRAGGRSPARFTHAAIWLTFVASMAFAAEPGTSHSLPGENGLFVVSVEERPEPVPLNELHTWIVHVESMDGEPVENAVIGVGGGMPMHDHGLPTAPRVTAAPGEGDYRLEGMKFQMPGHWSVRLEIEASGKSDNVTFELTL